MLRPLLALLPLLASLAPRPAAARDVPGAPLLATKLHKDVRAFVKEDAPRFALTHVRVIDGTGAPALPDRTLLVEDGLIRAVGDSRLPIPADTKIIDLSEHTVFPGLVGMHDHLFYPGPVPSDLSLPVPVSFARLYLAGGVTTIRTAGAMEPYTDLEIKKRIDAGRLVGPKMHVTGPFLEGPGGYNPQMHELRDAEDARKTVQFWADQGATSFKAYTHITHDQLAAAITAAHARSLKVTGHLCSVGYREAIALGIDNLEHGPFFSINSEFVPGRRRDTCPGETDRIKAALALGSNAPEVRQLIRDLVARKVAITSTLAVFEANLPNRPPLDPRVVAALVPELVVDFLSLRVIFSDPDGPIPRQHKLKTSPWPQLFAAEMAFERAFVKAGGLLIAGADPTGQGGVLAGFGNQRQVVLLVEAGFSAVEAIRIASANGAAFLGESSTIGSISPGKRADLVVVKGNPVTQIRDVERVQMVFKDGVGFDPARLVESVRGAVGLR
jgi:imidazolonepropionase-like amidohydrolase